MAFKWGLTVVNAPKPNLSAALDLLATMDFFDKYRTYVMLYSNIT
jgi:hypothetical protein